MTSTEQMRRSPCTADPELPGMVGRHPLMLELYRQVRAVAPGDEAVTIVGETGTGKELVARALHELSPRRGGPFVAVNAAALPASLFESELFGHERWAFSDAKVSKPGLLEAAHGSTFYLDELGSLRGSRQAKLLRVIEEKEARQVGGVTPRPAAPRWVVSCQKIDVRSNIGRGVRPDLWYRVSEVILLLPPLRRRVGDIPLLVEHFLRLRGYPADWFDDGALEALGTAPWPGNVRELRRVVRRLLATHNGRRITAPAVDEEIARAWPEREEAPSGGHGVRDGDPAERERLLTACRLKAWQARPSAEALGMSLATLYRKLRLHGVSLRAHRPRPLGPENSHENSQNR